MDLVNNKKGEVANSNVMELEGLKRSMAFLSANSISLKTLVTDRHTQVKAYLKKMKDVEHYFDVWHMSKGILKKLLKAGKKAGCGVIALWCKSITNHLYWVAASSGNDGAMKEAKWLSLLNHISNKHTGHGKLFKKCAHSRIKESREWIKKGTRQHKIISEIVTKKALITDIKKLSPVHQTYELEVFHRVVIGFAPKSLHFGYWTMETRLLVAALHFNENSNKTHKKTKDGELQWNVKYPKFQKGEIAVVVPVKEAPTFKYVTSIIDEIVKCRSEFKSRAAAKSTLSEHHQQPDPLTAGYKQFNKKELIRTRKSRFNVTT